VTIIIIITNCQRSNGHRYASNHIRAERRRSRTRSVRYKKKRSRRRHELHRVPHKISNCLSTPGRVNGHRSAPTDAPRAARLSRYRHARVADARREIWRDLSRVNGLINVSSNEYAVIKKRESDTGAIGPSWTIVTPANAASRLSAAAAAATCQSAEHRKMPGPLSAASARGRFVAGGDHCFQVAHNDFSHQRRSPAESMPAWVVVAIVARLSNACVDSGSGCGCCWTKHLEIELACVQPADETP
jgi:hypothetical protein